MEISAFFETNSIEAKEIWDKGTNLFSSYTGNLGDLFQDELSFYSYFRAYLLLTGDVDGATKLLNAAISYSSDHIVPFGSICMLPSALEYLLKFEVNLSSLHHSFTELKEQISKGKTAIEKAYSLGARFTLERLENEILGKSTVLVSNEEIQSFNLNFDSKEKKYIGDDEITLNLIPSFFQFDQDDGREVFDRYFKDHSFEVKKSEKMMLFDVLMTEDYSDLIYSYILESGNPRENSPMSHLSTLVALIEDLVGVDVDMFAKGIQSAKNRFPSSVQYSLTLPNPSGFVPLTYEQYQENYSFNV